MSFEKLTSGLCVERIAQEIEDNLDLFDTIEYRRHPKGKELSPHRECNDLHIRYNPIENEKRKDFHTKPHIADWYDSAKRLPECVSAVEQICCMIGAEMLGSVYIFKLAPGKKVYPHKDNSWNSKFYNKYLLGVKCTEGGIVRFDDGCFEPKTGDLFRFENNITHSVTNFSKEDWIVMVVNARPVSRGYYESIKSTP